jgi:hypothetical protein
VGLLKDFIDHAALAASTFQPYIKSILMAFQMAIESDDAELCPDPKKKESFTLTWRVARLAQERFNYLEYLSENGEDKNKKTGRFDSFVTALGQLRKYEHSVAGTQRDFDTGVLAQLAAFIRDPKIKALALQVQNIDSAEKNAGSFDRLRGRVPHAFSMLNFREIVDWAMGTVGRNETVQRKFVEQTSLLLVRLPTLMRGIAARWQRLFAMFTQTALNLGQNTSDNVLKTKLDVATFDRDRGKGLQHNAHAQSWLPRTADVRSDSFTALGRLFLNKIQTGSLDLPDLLMKGRKHYHNLFLFSASPYKLANQPISSQSMSDFTEGCFVALERMVPANKVHVWRHVSYKLLRELGVTDEECEKMGWSQGTQKKATQKAKSYGHVNMPLDPGLIAIATLGKWRNGHLVFISPQLCGVPMDIFEDVTKGTVTAASDLLASEEYRREMTVAGTKKGTYAPYESEEWEQEKGLIDTVRMTIIAVIQNTLLQPREWFKHIIFQHPAFKSEIFTAWYEENHEFAKYLQYTYETSKKFRETTQEEVLYLKMAPPNDGWDLPPYVLVKEGSPTEPGPSPMPQYRPAFQQEPAPHQHQHQGARTLPMYAHFAPPHMQQHMQPGPPVQMQPPPQLTHLQLPTGMHLNQHMRFSTPSPIQMPQQMQPSSNAFTVAPFNSQMPFSMLFPAAASHFQSTTPVITNDTELEKARQEAALMAADAASATYYGSGTGRKKEKSVGDVYNHMVGGWPKAGSQGLILVKVRQPSLPVFGSGTNKGYYLRRMRIFKLIRHVIKQDVCSPGAACTKLNGMLQALPPYTLKLVTKKYTLFGDDCYWVDAVAKQLGIPGGTSILMKMFKDTFVKPISNA